MPPRRRAPLSPAPTPILTTTPASPPTASDASPPPSAPGSAFPDPIPGVIDFGTVNILAGAPGAGKTTLYVDWCARWRDGRTICHHPTNAPTRLFYLSTDRGGRSTHKIFENYQLTDLTYYNPLDDHGFNRQLMRNWASALDVMVGCIDRLNPTPGSHLAIDPAAPFFVPGSQNDPRAIACLLWELHVIADARQITIFVMAHFSKQSADAGQRYRRPQDRISGSGAWLGFSDTQMYLLDPEPPEQPYHLFGWTPRHAAPEEFKFLRQGIGFVPYISLEDLGNDVPEQTQFVYNLIPAGGVKTSSLAAACTAQFGISSATFYRILKELQHVDAITCPHGWVKRQTLRAVKAKPPTARDHP